MEHNEWLTDTPILLTILFSKGIGYNILYKASTVQFFFTNEELVIVLHVLHHFSMSNKHVFRVYVNTAPL